MRNSILSRLIISVVLLCLMTITAAAQGSGVGANGYTSIEYDEATNTVTAYSETDVDYELSGYYQTSVQLIVSKSTGGVAASGSAQDNSVFGYAEVVLSFAGEVNTTYTATGWHNTFVTLYDYYNYYPYQEFYHDEYYLSYFQGQGIYEPWFHFFESPGYQQVEIQTNFVKLGKTYDSVSTTALTKCNDERDNIIKEYTTYKVSLKPTCFDFTQVRGNSEFPFSALNTGDYSWALIRDPLTINAIQFGLVEWSSQYGGSMIVNSAYRNPSRNSRVGGAKQSRHMYGDAVDIKNETRSRNEYDQRAAAAQRARADYIEPWTGPCGNGCVHADWRSHSGEYNY